MTAPAASASPASCSSAARPSSTIAPISAPRMGPEARSHVIGGPACRNVPASSTSDARRTPTRCGRAETSLPTASSFAASLRGSDSTRSSARAVPGSGGRHSTGTVATACARSASSSSPVPTVITRGAALSRVTGGSSRGGRPGRWR
ncbi:hypothetical protein ACFQYP_06625 [Nonomuraea antimicrobica]